MMRLNEDSGTGGQPQEGKKFRHPDEKILGWGARAQGHFTEKLRLYDSDILPCIDCRGCKNAKREYSCIHWDDLQEIYLKDERWITLQADRPL